MAAGIANWYHLSGAGLALAMFSATAPAKSLADTWSLADWPVDPGVVGAHIGIMNLRRAGQPRICGQGAKTIRGTTGVQHG